MIDYTELIATSFEDSHLLSKCRLMLLLFYLHVSGQEIYDYEFLFRVLWQLPEKDLLLIKKDYETIADKVRRGEAHLLSEGDTIYLGACRKGQKGDAPQSQPCSPIKANKRAFSLKPAYMRYILSHVIGSGQNYYSNYFRKEAPEFELVKAGDLANNSFEDVILGRFRPFIGCNYTQICQMLGRHAYQAKSKYADICGLIASNNASTRLSQAEEFIKSGITLKTVRLRPDGMPKESMSFKNINYCEVFDNDEWTDSEAYELFTTRFVFAVFRPVCGQTITIHNYSTGHDVAEQSYVLDNVFFWTMPVQDLEIARQYWLNIRENVLKNNIRLDAFWSIADHHKFHVRPKAVNASQLTGNPHGGQSPKFCYWFNADYVKTIIDTAKIKCIK